MIAHFGGVDAFSGAAQVLVVGTLALLRASRRAALFIGIIVAVVVAVALPQLGNAFMIGALPEACSTRRESCKNCKVISDR